MTDNDVFNTVDFCTTGATSCEYDEWKNELTPMLVDAIAEFIAGTPDPCEVTNALEAALVAGGMTFTQIASAVERFLPKE